MKVWRINLKKELPENGGTPWYSPPYEDEISDDTCLRVTNGDLSCIAFINDKPEPGFEANQLIFLSDNKTVIDNLYNGIKYGITIMKEYEHFFKLEGTENANNQKDTLYTSEN